MDVTTLAMAKSYTDSQRLGYSEYKYQSIVFNGNIADKATISGEIFEADGLYVHVSNKVCAGKKVGYAIVYNENDTTALIDGDMLEVNLTSDGIWFLAMVREVATLPRCIAVSFGTSIAKVLNVPSGTYLWVKDSECSEYIDTISGYFVEDIQTIDPKYIPNFMPMVDISEETTLTAFENINASQGVTADEAAALDDAATTKMPLIARFFIGGEVVYTGVLWYSHESNNLYIGTTGNFVFTFRQKDDGSWEIVFSSAA